MGLAFPRTRAYDDDNILSSYSPECKAENSTKFLIHIHLQEAEGLLEEEARV